MKKNNGVLKQRLIASLLAISILPAAVSGCSNKNSKEKAPTSQVTQENIWLQLASYIDSLKSMKEVKEILTGLHMSDEFLENEEIMSELLEIVLENKDYASTIDFISSSTIPEFYYTSDGRLSFVTNKLYIKKIKDDELIIKSIQVDNSVKTDSIWEDTFFSENGSGLQSETSIGEFGSIDPKITPEIVYSRGTLYNSEKSKYYYFYYGNNRLLFSDSTNVMKISSGYDSCTMEISDWERQELISNYNKHNHKQLMTLENKLAEKYKNSYLQENLRREMSFQESDKGIGVSISKDENGKNVSAYVYSLSGDSYNNSDGCLTVHSDINDAQYTILKDYMERKDENIVAYVEQIASEQNAANDIKSIGETSAKVYTKK